MGLRQGWGIPALVVLMTTAAWYVGDALYNNYEEYFWQFGNETLDNSWWQVLLFLMTFLLLVKPVHDGINRKVRDRESFAVKSYELKLFEENRVQTQVDKIFNLLLAVWVVLTLAALSRVNWDVWGLFFPYLAGYSVEPWGRGRIGGQFDAIISFATYLQIFLTASFGLVFALSRNPRTRWLAGICFALTAPYYLMGRTRNTMLAVLIPGILAWVIMRLRVGWFGKLVALLTIFSIINFWMLLVMGNRAQQVENLAASMLRSDAEAVVESASHEGLNMFEELSWAGQLMKQGSYRPNWGARYWAEIVNPIPRGLWPGKPEIGLDYAAARGLAEGSAADNTKEGGVAATVSTGMIGQGVVNFGPIFGPMFAALLMVFWVALVARQDLMAQEHPARFLLYALGIILTFNMGRDITFIVTYPFFFGYAFIFYMERKRGTKKRETPSSTFHVGGEVGRREENGQRGAERGGRWTKSTAELPPQNGGVEDSGPRDVGAGGTVRTMATRTPNRVAAWMPRRLQKQIAMQRDKAETTPTKETNEAEHSGSKGQQDTNRPRQLAVPFQNYRRYRA